ncbi:MAG: site-specific DNA-methyltransferase [Acidobacteriota bacterium]|nr:site-specific DNA-methyltransferase [Acidobacteriota bacterium]
MGSPIPNDLTTGEGIVRLSGIGLRPDVAGEENGATATPVGVGRAEAASVRLITTVIQTDCLAGLDGLEKGSVAAIVTSPPYNIGKQYQGSDDNKDDYQSWMRSVFVACKRALADNGHFFLQVGGIPSRPLIPWEVITQALSAGFVLQNQIVWVKSVAIREKTYGHFKPINSKRFMNQTHEFIFHLTNKGETSINRLAVGVPFTDESNIKRFGHENNRRCRGNTWFIPYETITSKKKGYNHPAAFPVALPEMCIKLAGIPQGSLVVDPYVGTGTTLVACKRLQMNGIGFDISPEYCKMAEERLIGLEPATEPAILVATLTRTALGDTASMIPPKQATPQAFLANPETEIRFSGSPYLRRVPPTFRYANTCPCLEDVPLDLGDHLDGFGLISILRETRCGVVDPRPFDDQWARIVHNLCEARGIPFRYGHMGDRERFPSKLLGSVEREDIPAFFTGTQPEGRSAGPFRLSGSFASDMGMRTSCPAGVVSLFSETGKSESGSGLPRPEQAAN